MATKMLIVSHFGPALHSILVTQSCNHNFVIKVEHGSDQLILVTKQEHFSPI